MFGALLAHLGEHRALYVIPALVTGMVLAIGGTAFVDLRVELALAAHQQEMLPVVQAYSERMAGIEGALGDIRKGQLEQDMRELKRLLCASPGQRQLINELENAQKEYMDLSGGSRYPVPDCQTLGAISVLPASAAYADAVAAD
jgi:hypothetical protein